MQEHRTCVDRNGTDSTFSNAVLMVCVDTAEGHGLTSALAFVNECFGSKDPIIAMIMLNADIIGHALIFESLFAFDCLPGVS